MSSLEVNVTMPFDGLQRRARFREDLLANFRERHAGAPANQQGDAEAVLQRLQGLASAGLGHAKHG